MTAAVRTSAGAQAPAATVAVPTGGRRRWRSAGAPSSVLLLALLLVVVLRGTVVTSVRIDSGSMQPTLAPGDVVLLDRHVAVEDLQRGDLVAFRSPADGRSALKRVVGLPGERLVVEDAVLHVDGAPVREPYVDLELVDASFTPTFVVPADSVFVMGDNRGNSEDSRSYGPVPGDALDGRVLVRAWPPVRIGGPHGRPAKP